MRCAAFLAGGAVAVPALAGCGDYSGVPASDEDRIRQLAEELANRAQELSQS